MPQPSLDRRSFLRGTALVSLGPIAWAITPASSAAATAAPAKTHTFTPFVDAYKTNTTAHLSADSNAAVRALSGMTELWHSGTSWDNGEVLAPEVLRENIRYVEHITQTRTDEQAKQSYLYDRRDQSYSVIAGLGPLAAAYREGAKAVTSIVTAPDGTPPTKISDSVPADAPAGSAIGAGSESSELGPIVKLINTVRGTYSSSNPSKYTYNYPRAWRMNDRSQVIDTGQVDEFGFPIYESKVIVAPQLLRQRGDKPADDGGFPSGHSNAAWLAAIGMAYAVPERYQELMVIAAEIGHSRIISGMHSPVDVVGGRILATALAAAILYDPANAEFKAAARECAVDYFTSVTGTDDLYAAAHTGQDDPYTDRDANARVLTPQLTYLSPLNQHRRDPDDDELTVPKGAEALLETRFPYLDPAEIREILRTTALPAGYPVLGGLEQWGRLNLFAAADGHGRFDRHVTVVMDAAQGGFSAADTWRNNVVGSGGLTKRGSGQLTLAGDNSFRGGTHVAGGTVTAGSRTALGRGDVSLRAGLLEVAADEVRIDGDYTQRHGTVLRAELGSTVVVDGAARIADGTTLDLIVSGSGGHQHYTVLRAGHLHGRFATVRVNGQPVQASYRGASVTVQA